MAGSILVFDPTAVTYNEPPQSRQTLDGLTGKVVGFIDNAKPTFNYLVDDLAELLVTKYGVASVIKRRKTNAGIPAPDALMKEVSEQCDAVITGLGD